MKRARPGQNQKPNFSRRLAAAARKLISAALHKARCNCRLAAIILGAKMRLDDCAAVRLTARAWANQFRRRKLSRHSPQATKNPRADACSARRRICSARTASTPPASTPSSTRPAPRRPRSTNCSDRRPTSCNAVLESEGKAWREWFIGAMEDGGGDAQTKLTRIFPALKTLVRRGALLRLPLHQRGRRARQGRKTVPQHRAAPQEGGAGAYRKARR